MSENCSHNCEHCNERTKESLLASLHEGSKVKKVIGVVSGKGGVGKSLVMSMLAVTAQRNGYRTAILDADITSPSIPKMFGIHERAVADDNCIIPAKTKTGISVMSMNLLTEDETVPVIWRGPMIAGVVKQFWSDVLWGDIDYMFIDMPPGTGDVPLTVFQSIPVDGIMIVASPQELVGMIVEKAVRMANRMNIPVIGLVENMSYALCSKCGEKLYIFGESHIENIAEKYDINSIAKLPIEPELAKACDEGAIELFDGTWLDELFQNMNKNKTKGDNIMKIAVSCNDNQIWAHFGHCKNFIIYETENGKIISEQSVPNPGHKPGFLPNFLADMGVKVMISGGMGGGAVDIFNERDVEVVLGAQGDAKLAVEAYLRGELESTGSVCHKHEHADECGKH